MKSVGKYLAVFVALIAAYLLFGLTSGLVSDRAVERHVRQTLEQTDLKADFWFAFLYKPNYYMDNFTDALIINQAWSLGKEDSLNLWQRVMLVPRQTGSGEECESLRRMTEEDSTMHTIYYPRYWHGSTFLMRFLLAADDYVVLRTFFYILSSLLLLWVVLALARKAGVTVATAYAFALTLVDVFMMQFSIQFLPVLLITLGGSLWVIYKARTPRQFGMICFVTGSLTAYFDLLTAPLLTWGIPLLVWVAVGGKKGIHSFTWFAGYVATWTTKWLLATLTTPMNVFTDASQQASLRSAVEDYSRWDAVVRNFQLVPWLYVVIAVAVLLFIAVQLFNAKGWRQSLMCLAVAVAPVVWYMAMANHSYQHFWFTYRSLGVTVMGLFFAVASLRKVRIKK